MYGNTKFDCRGIFKERWFQSFRSYEIYLNIYVFCNRNSTRTNLLAIYVGNQALWLNLYAFGNGILGCSFAFETIHLYNNYFQPREETTIVALKGRNIICLKWFAIGDGFCRSWGILSLTIAYCWQLYTLWILVQLHEAVPGKRYNRYVELAQAAFGENTCLSSNSNTSIFWRIGSDASPPEEKEKGKNSNN